MAEDRRRQADALLDLYDVACEARACEAVLDDLVVRLRVVVQAREDGRDLISSVDGMPTDLELRTAAVEARTTRRRFEEAWARCLCLGLEREPLKKLADPHRVYAEDELERMNLDRFVGGQGQTEENGDDGTEDGQTDR